MALSMGHAQLQRCRVRPAARRRPPARCGATCTALTRPAQAGAAATSPSSWLRRRPAAAPASTTRRRTATASVRHHAGHRRAGRASGSASGIVRGTGDWLGEAIDGGVQASCRRRAVAHGCTARRCRPSASCPAHAVLAPSASSSTLDALRQVHASGAARPALLQAQRQLPCRRLRVWPADRSGVGRSGQQRGGQRPGLVGRHRALQQRRAAAAHSSSRLVLMRAARKAGCCSRSRRKRALLIGPNSGDVLRARGTGGGWRRRGRDRGR
jgi:hypothetical protein